MKSLFTSVFLFASFYSFSQDKLPYAEIPETPAEYNAGTVVARMIDGLGFRFYWATEGLRAEDLKFKPNNEARTSRETIEHILGLSTMILNSALKKVNEGGNDFSKMTFESLRKKTLLNLKEASTIFNEVTDLSEHSILFKRGEQSSEFPFWYQLNGPIADALWHTGQVVSFRRSSGNPFNSKVSVFSGKVRQ
jgi:hypothetical protein